MGRKKYKLSEVLKEYSFSEILAARFRAAGYEAIDNTFSDKSARWVELKKNGFTIEIDFDLRGEIIKKVSLHQDIVEVVDSKRLF